MAEYSGSKALPLPTPTLDDVKRRFEAVDITTIDEIIDIIKTILKTKSAPKHKTDYSIISSKSTSKWISFIESGSALLSFVNAQNEKLGEMVYLSKSRDQVFRLISDILEGLEQIHWAAVGLSMIGHLLTKIGQPSDNREECFQLLQYMVDLADHMNKLRRLVPEEKEKLKNALVIIVKGSMLCAKQLYSNGFFSSLKTSLQSQHFSELRLEIEDFRKDFQLTAQIAALEGQPERLPLRQPDYPADAVAIEEREQEVEDLLHMDTKELFRAVIIYGIGGIGKTYLAKAVCSRLKLSRYNYSRVVMDIDPQKNDIKKKQEQILKDALPNYNSGRAIDLRDQEEGREVLTRAFQEANTPVFLYIDNVLRPQDLEDLLPKGLESIGKPIRLLLTTRDLRVTSMLNKRCRHEYLIKPLPNNDALNILCNEPENLDRMNDDVEDILKICNGVPLILKIVGDHLESQEYKVDKCSQILNALQKGNEIKEKNLSKSLVDFVFEGLEIPIQEAFLDICCFFYGMFRKVVEYAVGSMELKALEGAALITCKSEAENYEEIVVVHDVIKARGESMARSTRTADIKSFEAAVREKRLETIKGIYLSCDQDSFYVLQKNHLDSMSKSLQVLWLGPRISVSGTSNMTFPELRYVNLDPNIPCLPFYSEALETPAVYVGPLRKGGVRIDNLPQSLQLVTATGTDNVEWTNEEQYSKELKVVPKFSLKELNFCTVCHMKTLPEGFQNFTALEILNLDSWKNMEKLPSVVCELPRLRILTLDFCENLKFFPLSFGNLITLEFLALKGCYKLKNLPSTIGRLKDLRCLILESCSSLRDLPSNFGLLTALQCLNLKACSFLKYLPGFAHLKELKYLNIQYCRNLRCDFNNAPSDLQIELE